MAGYGQMMQQMKKVQREIAEKQAELDARAFRAESGAGAIVVNALGTKEITEITISPELLIENNGEMVGDLLRIAINAVITEIETTTEAELSKVTGGMSIPGLF